MTNIDFENNKIEFPNNKILYINTDQMGYERLIKFIEWMPVVAVGKSHLELMTFISGIFKSMTSGGDDFKKTYFDVSTRLLNYTKSFESATSQEFLSKNLDTILSFCALVCNYRDEDMSIFNQNQIDRKVALFKEHGNMMDFFFLAKKLVPMYHQKLIELTPVKHQGG